MIADVIAALVTHLQNDAPVNALVAGRVYGGKLPRDQAVSMPRSAITIEQTGGALPAYASAQLPVQVQRVDVKCYGENDFEADKLRRTAYSALKGVKRLKVAQCLLHWINPAGGAVSLVDQDTDWHLIVQAFQVKASDVVV